MQGKSSPRFQKGCEYRSERARASHARRYSLVQAPHLTQKLHWFVAREKRASTHCVAQVAVWCQLACRFVAHAALPFDASDARRHVDVLALDVCDLADKHP